MKKRFVILVLLVFLLVGCSSNNGVKELSEPVDVITFNEEIKNDQIITNGKNFDIDQVFEEDFEYEEKSGFLKRKTITSYEKNGINKFSLYFEYENDQIVTENFYRDDNKLISKTFYKYDKKNRLIEEKSVIKNDIKVLKEYEYKENMNNITIFYPNGEVMREEIIYFDSNNRVLKKESYNSEGKLNGTRKMFYEDEYITKYTTIENSKIRNKTYEEKNNMGDIIRVFSISYLDEGEPYTLFYLVENTYDKNMKLIKKTRYSVKNQMKVGDISGIDFD